MLHKHTLFMRSADWSIHAVHKHSPLKAMDFRYRHKGTYWYFNVTLLSGKKHGNDQKHVLKHCWKCGFLKYINIKYKMKHARLSITPSQFWAVCLNQTLDTHSAFTALYFKHFCIVMFAYVSWISHHSCMTSDFLRGWFWTIFIH